MRASTRLIITVAVGALLLPAAASAQEWTGFYAGVQASWAETETSSKLDITGPLTTNLPLAVATAEERVPTDIGDHIDSAGVNLGYLVQRGDWVLGGEIEANEGGDFVAPALAEFAGGNSTTLKYYGANIQSEWAASVRLRGGWLARPNLMIYGVGGYAVRDLRIASATMIQITSSNFGSFISTAKDDAAGWVLGGGVEWRPVDRWGLRFEYARTDYGDVSETMPIGGPFGLTPARQADGRYTTSLVQDEVRLGVSYHF